jgi:ankyrin repeat protein
MELKTTDLHKAVSQCELDVVRNLIRQGADVNARDLNGHTPLHLCSGPRYIPLAEILLEAGADKEAAYVDKNVDVGSPLFEAAASGNSEMVAFFLSKGADIEHKNALDRSPLDIACYSDRGDITTVKLLIEGGANLTAINFQGEPPLFSALRSGKVDIVQYLIKKGADIHFKKQTERNILFCLASALPRYCFDADIVIQAKESNITQITFLANNGMSISISYQGDGIANEHIKKGVIKDEKEKARVIKHCIPYLNRKDDYMGFARYFISKGVSVKDTDKETGTTLLMLACDVNCPLDFISLILEHGSDVSRKDSWGLTALHYSCRKGNIPAAKILIDNGAGINAPDDIGFTPLHEAAENNRIQVVRLLLKRGVDKTLSLTEDFEPYKKGFTPEDVARTKGNEDCAKILRSEKY